MDDKWADDHRQRINRKHRDSNCCFTALEVHEKYTGYDKFVGGSDLLQQAFDSGKFLNEQGIEVCYEAYLYGWLDCYYRQKKG